MMKVEVLDVTPAMAKNWLKNNQLNRPVRKAHVKFLANAMQRGEWAVTHQGIAINGSRLLDGQHRLLALLESKLPAVKMTVCTGADSSTFDVIDIGQRRSNSDIFREDLHVMHPVSFIATMLLGRGVTPREIRPIYEKLRGPIREIIDQGPRSTKRFTAAPIKVGALAAILNGESKEYVHDIYHNMCSFHVEKLPRVAQLFVKQLSLDTTTGKKISTTNRYDLLVRAWTVFQSENADNSKLSVKDTNNRMDEIRRVYRKALRMA